MSHIIIEHFHGAASRVPVAATACTMRVTGFNVVIASQWTDPRETERGIRWARETFASLDAVSRADALRQLPGRRCAPTPPRSPTDRTSPRLREIKTKYDPDNFFRHNVNILPK